MSAFVGSTTAASAVRAHRVILSAPSTPASALDLATPSGRAPRRRAGRPQRGEISWHASDLTGQAVSAGARTATPARTFSVIAKADDEKSPSWNPVPSPARMQPWEYAFRATGTNLPAKRIAFVWKDQMGSGAYAESALRTCFSSNEYEAFPVENFRSAFEAVSEGVADLALVPIENDAEGSFHRNYDLLLQFRDLTVVEELVFPVEYCLAANAGVARSDLRRVVGHPQALAACSKYVDALRLPKEQSNYSKGAAKMITEEGHRDMGAIIPPVRARAFGLEILERGIEEERSVTRFLVLQRTGEHEKQGAAEGPAGQTQRPMELRRWGVKTSIAFALKNQVGALFKALAIFALRDIDLTKIESRPDGDGGYAFYVDIVGQQEDESIQRALSHLEEVADWVQVIGSFPVFNVPTGDELEGAGAGRSS
eukprot:tig00021127_g18778.t1